MATRTAPARRTRQADPEPESNGERDFTPYATKPPTIVMERFGDWLMEVTGIEFKTQKEEDAFYRGVQLGGSLRMPFQQSDWWKGHDDNPRNHDEEPEPEPAPRARRGRKPAEEEEEPAKPASRRGRKPAKPAPEPEPEDEPEDEGDEPEEDEAPAPRSRRGRKPANAANGKPATTRRSGRSRKPATEEDEVEAPY